MHSSQFRQKPGCGKRTGVDRSRTATTISLKKFKDKMSEFHALRESIHQEHCELVERRVYSVKGTRADEETINQLTNISKSNSGTRKRTEKYKGSFYNYNRYLWIWLYW
ncbi:hypothetical protein LXL04_022851 [Taraxacum kok-saghyz]